MMQQMKPLKIILIIFLLITTSCVSVKIAESERRKADNVVVKSPGAHFASYDAQHVDAAWKNEKNGNTISYLSDCNENSDPSLDSIYHEILQDIDRHETEMTKIFNFNGREALRAVSMGYVDGIESKFEMVIFKKNSCVFIISYVALSTTYKKDQDAFQQFLQGFVVP